MGEHEVSGDNVESTACDPLAMEKTWYCESPFDGAKMGEAIFFHTREGPRAGRG